MRLHGPGVYILYILHSYRNPATSVIKTYLRGRGTGGDGMEVGCISNCIEAFCRFQISTAIGCNMRNRFARFGLFVDLSGLGRTTEVGSEG